MLNFRRRQIYCRTITRRHVAQMWLLKIKLKYTYKSAKVSPSAKPYYCIFHFSDCSVGVSSSHLKVYQLDQVLPANWNLVRTSNFTYTNITPTYIKNILWYVQWVGYRLQNLKVVLNVIYAEQKEAQVNTNSYVGPTLEMFTRASYICNTWRQ